jgi:hypothetical protein
MPTRAASGCWWCGAFLLLASLSLSARAETPRAELGKRLRRFEIAWQEADGERRAVPCGIRRADFRP